VFKYVFMATHLSAVVKEVLDYKERPDVALVVGDLAQKQGYTADYATFVDLLRPLREAGLPLHLTLGNHDHRDHFRAGAMDNGIRPAGGRIAEVVALPRANLFILDTLDKTDAVTGTLGADQLAWLAKALDDRPDKPAIIVGHHDPMFEPPPMGKKPMGLTDTAELFQVLEPRRQVKAYVFGHTHAWAVKQHNGIHLVNLPPTSYLFVEGKPSGWVNATLRPDGARLELRCLDPLHPQQGEVADLKWRT
jgi:3',5'-cyclic AMP phosphodiesterase CpdA